MVERQKETQQIALVACFPTDPPGKKHKAARADAPSAETTIASVQTTPGWALWTWMRRRMRPKENVRSSAENWFHN